jgi:hypothetical protein
MLLKLFLISKLPAPLAGRDILMKRVGDKTTLHGSQVLIGRSAGNPGKAEFFRSPLKADMRPSAGIADAGQPGAWAPPRAPDAHLHSGDFPWR